MSRSPESGSVKMIWQARRWVRASSPRARYPSSRSVRGGGLQSVEPGFHRYAAGAAHSAALADCGKRHAGPLTGGKHTFVRQCVDGYSVEEKLNRGRRFRERLGNGTTLAGRLRRATTARRKGHRSACVFLGTELAPQKRPVLLFMLVPGGSGTAGAESAQNGSNSGPAQQPAAGRRPLATRSKRFQPVGSDAPNSTLEALVVIAA